MAEDYVPSPLFGKGYLNSYDEASAGDPVLAAERMALLDGIPLLPHVHEVAELAEQIMSLQVLPDKAPEYYPYLFERITN